MLYKKSAHISHDRMTGIFAGQLSGDLREIARSAPTSLTRNFQKKSGYHLQKKVREGYTST
jgi:hypothetical protein